jgi:hypothetical protein
MLNTHWLSGRARAKAVADYGFLGWAVLKELLDRDYCDRLVRQAETLQFDTIFNAQTKGKSLESKQRTRAVTKGVSQEGKRPMPLCAQFTVCSRKC